MNRIPRDTVNAGFRRCLAAGKPEHSFWSPDRANHCICPACYANRVPGRWSAPMDLRNEHVNRKASTVEREK